MCIRDSVKAMPTDIADIDNSSVDGDSRLFSPVSGSRRMDTGRAGNSHLPVDLRRSLNDFPDPRMRLGLQSAQITAIPA